MSETYKGGEKVRLEGAVYCYVHGAVHDDTTDPFDCPDDRCWKTEHRAIYYSAQKGDLK